MDWFMNFLGSTFGKRVACVFAGLALGIGLAMFMPTFFVTHETLAQELTPLERNDLLIEYKQIEFQRSMVLQRKWDLENYIDQVGGRATIKQQGRIAELNQEAEALRKRAVAIDNKMRACR